MADRLDAGVDIILHATEDPAKFFAAIGEYGLREEDFSSATQEGHFGNPIRVVGARVSGRRAAAFVGRLIRRIPREQFEGLLDDLGISASSSGLYLRLDRQEFVRGRVVLHQQNPIRIKVFVPVYQKGMVLETYRRLLGSFREG